MIIFDRHNYVLEVPGENDLIEETRDKTIHLNQAYPIRGSWKYSNQPMTILSNILIIKI